MIPFVSPSRAAIQELQDYCGKQPTHRFGKKKVCSWCAMTALSWERIKAFFVGSLFGLLVGVASTIIAYGVLSR